MKRLGLVTIGQTPRVDLIPDVKRILGNDVEIIEKGALDGLTIEQVMEFQPSEADEVLVTRMADGREVRIAERHIFPRLQQRIMELENEGIRVILIACTGEFPAVDSSSILIYPNKVLHHILASICENLTLGVLVPDELQIESTIKRWSKVTARVFVEAGSPYGDFEKVIKSAERLVANHHVDLLLMDCMGYTISMKETLVRYTHRPVILARSVVARIAAEIIF